LNDSTNLNGQCFTANRNDEYIVAGSTGNDNNKQAMAFKVNASGNLLWAFQFEGVEFRQIEYLHSDISGNRYYVMTGIYKDTSNIHRLMAAKINQNGALSWAYVYSPQNEPTLSSEEPKSLLVEREIITIAGTRYNSTADVFKVQIDYNGILINQLMNLDYGRNERDPFLNKYRTGYLFSFTAEDQVSDANIKDKHAIIKFRSDWFPYWTRYYTDTISRHHTANAIHEFQNTGSCFAVAGTNLSVDSIYEPYYFAVDSNGAVIYQAYYPDTFSKTTSYFMPVDTSFVLHTHDIDMPINHKFNLITLNKPGNTNCYRDILFSSKLVSPEISLIDFRQDSLEAPDSLFLESSVPYTFVYDCRNDSVHKINGVITSDNLYLLETGEQSVTIGYSINSNQTVMFEIYDIMGRKLQSMEGTLTTGHNSIQIPTQRRNKLIIIKGKLNNINRTFKIIH
jgi:hypothetical protein